MVRTFSSRCSVFLFVGLALVFSGHFNPASANPHTTILKKNNPIKYDSRDEIEGSGGVLNHIRIPHGCNGQTVKAMGVVFPNGVDSVATDKSNGQEVDLAEHITGAVIRVHPVQDHDVFKKIEVQEGDVQNVGNSVSEGVRAIHYTTGNLGPENVGLIPFDASFPTFNDNSCATSLQVNMAIANYCTHTKKKDDRADVWIGHMTTLFDDPAVVVQSPPGFWPQLTVIRDVDNHPLPGNCAAGLNLVVTPAAHEIDHYLPIQGFWPKN